MAKDIRKTWYNGLYMEDAIKANSMLQDIVTLRCVDGGPSYSELVNIGKLAKAFNKLTGKKAGEIIDEFESEGYCFGFRFIPEAYEDSEASGEWVPSYCYGHKFYEEVRVNGCVHLYQIPGGFKWAVKNMKRNNSAWIIFKSYKRAFEYMESEAKYNQTQIEAEPKWL